MKATRCYLLVMLMAAIALGMRAQTANTITVPDITAQIGQAQLPVNVENTSELVAMQFDLTLPQGMTAEPVGTLTSRSVDHAVTVRYIRDQLYRVVLFSPTNTPIRGQSGTLLYLTISITTSCADGEQYPIAVNNAVLTNATGENVLTGISSGAITVTEYLPPIVETNKKAYKPGETVVISGQLFGTENANTTAHVYVVHNGSQETLTVKTDENGKFTSTYNISSSQSGHYIIELSSAGAERSEELASFDVFGLLLGSYRSDHDIEIGSTLSGRISISNAVDLRQTGLKAVLLGDSVNCAFELSLPEEIDAGSTIEMTYTITPKALSEGNSWHQMPVEISSAEGAKATYTFYYYVVAAQAMLKAEPSTIVATMTKGATREYPLVITNTGKGETGVITADLPYFMNSATPRTMPSLGSGQSATILLELTPADDMTLNVPITGNLAINCENGNGLSVNFSVEPVSESMGTLVVDATDELTYYAETVKAPHVVGAKIEIKHPTTEEVMTSGVTDADGLFSVQLAEGLYVVEASAAKHQVFRKQVMIDPGRNTSIEAFMSYDNVTYTWDVVESEVEDTYNLELVADYDVRVPKPILDVKIAAEEQPYDGSIIPVVVTNKGLINVNDVNVTLALTPDDFKAEFESNPHLDLLAPRQSETFYAKVRYTGSSNSRRLTGSSAPGVGAAGAEANGTYPCGNERRDIGGGGMKIWNVTTPEITHTDSIVKQITNTLASDTTHTPRPGSSTEKTVVSVVTNVPVPTDDTKVCFDPTDSNDTNNPNRPDDPVGLPNHDGDPEPDPEDCNSDKKMHFTYHLEPVSGTRYDVKGVAADGVSQVKLKLDSSAVIPADDCKKYYGFRWELLDSLGTIEGNSFKEAIYTAPDSFPYRTGSSFKVRAMMRYYESSDPFPPTECYSDIVEIEIIRPPVVFIHGLSDSEQIFAVMDSVLVKSGLYKKDINFRVDYTTTNTYSFSRNVPVVGLGIQKAQRRALCQGYVATKCDLVGHSMGGILARLFVQNGGEYYGANTKEVNRIITLNTPHAGSELADIVAGHDKIVGTVVKTVFNVMQGMKGYDVEASLNAVRDLSVESDAIANLNMNALSSLKTSIEVPVHAIATSLESTSNLIAGMGMGISTGLGVAASLIAAASTTPETGPLGIGIGAAVGILVATYAGHLMGDDLPQLGIGDWVVSTPSQIGGCSSYTVIEEDKGAQTIGGLIGGLTGGTTGVVIGQITAAALTEPWHITSPKHSKVIDVMKDLLSRDVRDSIFSRDWFAPEPRYFDHDLWMTKWLLGAGLSMVSAQAKGIMKLVSDGFDNIMSGFNFLNGFGTYVSNNYSNSRALVGNSDCLTDKRYIRLELKQQEGYSNPMVIANYGGDRAAMAFGYDVEMEVPATFAGEVLISVLMNNEDGNIYYEQYAYTVEEPLATPVSLTLEETTLNVDDSEPLRLYCTWNDGSVTKVVPDSITFEYGNLAAQVGKYIVGLKKGRTHATASYRGLTCEGLIRVFASDNDDDDTASESVCSSVKLSFKQQMVMSRQAFRGTLTVNNGSSSKQLKDLKLQLQVTDDDGHIATEREFSISPEALDGFDGELNFTSGWLLDAESKGTATILYVPTKYAAQQEPKRWWFGGSFSYTDPDSGLTVTRELHSVQLIVNPTPELTLDYFLQRDVLGDDPLTEDVTEECQPAEFALLINNIGYGDAQNVSLSTCKPEIVDNEKGLAVDFSIISSQMNGEEKSMPLGSKISTDFGTIPAHTQAYAQWWIEISLLGHFTHYDVTVNHVSSSDTPGLSLMDRATAHELIHGYTPAYSPSLPNATSAQRAFLVNDFPDSRHLPDTVYFTDGTQQSVSQATNAEVIGFEGDTCWLTVHTDEPGWNYGSLPDPTGGRRKLLAVILQDSGERLPIDNVWQTDRTLRDGADPIYENRLHFILNMNGTSETIGLTFEQAQEAGQPMLIALDEGWNWFSSYLREDLPLDDIKTHATRIVGQTDEAILDPEYGWADNVGTLSARKAYKILASSTVFLVFNGHLFTPDEQTVGLQQGWNWMGYPSDTAVPLTTIASADDGDVITAQTGFACYDGTSWEGTLSSLTPGQGYLYKSATAKVLTFNAAASRGDRAYKAYGVYESYVPDEASGTGAVDPHRYPSTMNITASIERDGMVLDGSHFTVYAFAADELRGVSQFVGSNHYLTVYGDEPVVISFIVESAETGETFAAAETLTFVSDVVGSRKSPYAVSISTTTGISQQMTDTPMAIYTLDGILVSRDATIRTLHTLPKGVYIVNGRKTVVK